MFTSTRSFSFLLLSLALLFTSSQAACPPGACQPHGECVMEDTQECREHGTCEEHCVCHDGFSGTDCSFFVELCPRDTGDKQHSLPACYNGGQCYPEPNEDGTDFSWKCDCSAAMFGDALALRHQCKFASDTTVSCEVDHDSSDYAFCVNGGSCGQNMVESGEVFKGCTCPHDFEGRHCQFPAGSGPKLEFLLYASQRPNRMSTGTIVGVVLATLVATAVLLHMVVSAGRRRVAQEAYDVQQKAAGVHVTASVSLDNDEDDHTLQMEDIDVSDELAVNDREII